MGKTKKGKNHPSEVYKTYENGKTKNHFCPKCGAGTFMSEHKDRRSCGKCGYTEFKQKE